MTRDGFPAWLLVAIGLFVWLVSAAGPVVSSSGGAPPKPSPVRVLGPDLGQSSGGAPLPTQDPGELTSSISSETGIASYVNAGLGARYLALPDGPGIRVTICREGTKRCVERVSTDAGPDLAMQRAGRIADVSYADFRFLCSCTPEDVGLLRVTATYGRGVVVRGNPTPPATSTEAIP